MDGETVEDERSPPAEASGRSGEPAASERSDEPGTAVETEGVVGDWVGADSRAIARDASPPSGRARDDGAPTRRFWPSVLAGVAVSALLPLDGAPWGLLILVVASGVAGTVRAGGVDHGGVAGAVAAVGALAVAIGLSDASFFVLSLPPVLVAVGALVGGTVAAAAGAVCGGVGGALGATGALAPEERPEE